MSTMTLGTVLLPPEPGTGVGQFSFRLDDDNLADHLEIGAFVSADTPDGVFTGALIDMRTVGRQSNPVTDALASDVGAAPTGEVNRSVIVGVVQVFASPRLRSIRGGTVRPASRSEIAEATGEGDIDWPVPAGIIELVDGSRAPVYYDGAMLMGPDSQGLTVGGMSGRGAKSSYAGVVLRGAVHTGSPEGESVGAIVFNNKGEDLLWLDQPPKGKDALTDDDRAMYETLGVPAEPFEHVEVYAPSLPGGGGTHSPREDALRLRWGLREIWPYLRHVVPDLFNDDSGTKAGLLADIRESLVNHPNPSQRVDTFSKLDAFLSDRIARAEDDEDDEVSTGNAWRGHHKLSLQSIKRRICSLPSRFHGLLTQDESGDADDVPTTGWSHGRVIVVDIAPFSPDVQGLVIARTLERLTEAAQAGELGVDHLAIWSDELNEFAPAQGAEMATVRKGLRLIATQGRYAGLTLFGMAQMLSKVDELVRDNAASMAVGFSRDAELSSGAYGRLPAGITERIATQKPGQMVVWHPTFRAPMPVRFPRPAWRSGMGDSGGRKRASDVSDGGLGPRSQQRLREGIPDEVADEIAAAADDPDKAAEALAQHRRPDMTEVSLGGERTPPRGDEDDPFAL